MNQFRNRWPITAVFIGWLAMVLAVAWAGQWLLGQPANASTQSPSGTTDVTETAFLPIILNPPPPPIPSNSNNILFLSERGASGTYDMYTMPLAGGPPTQVTNAAFPWDGWYVTYNRFANARWSPDGQQIAYQYDNRLYLMNWDGSGQQIIFDDANYVLSGRPAWSLNGQQIGIIGYRRSQNSSGTTDVASGLILIDLTMAHPWTLLAENTVLDEATGLHWTADGQHILAKRRDNGSFVTLGVLSIPLNGSAPSTLFGDYHITNMALSPARTHMAFAGSRVMLYVANADGTGPITTVFNGYQAGEMVGGALWRADGQQMLFLAYTQTATKMYTADFDGQNLQPRELPQLSQAFYTHHWTADNRLLVSTGPGVGQGQHDIFTMNLDGSELINLTADNPRMDYVIDYRP